MIHQSDPDHKPLRVVTGSRNPAKTAAVREAFRLLTGAEPTVEGIAVEDTTAQPMTDEETLAGAEYRARSARSARPEADFWVGIEGGVETVGGRLMVNAWVVVLSGDAVGRSRSATFELPEAVAEPIRNGTEMGGITARVQQGGDWREMGLVSELSSGVVTRTTYYVQPVVLALLKFLPTGAGAVPELRY
ncbi:inosine/xanthosine triphosphatase [Lysinibacillus sp. NPDC056185]|uniref:inosine/xanthosine triphosphatase n=1 Tax=Lysinibacillus sp. NPDC056185 TaxID=3345739 RepID=UPI0039EFAD21